MKKYIGLLVTGYLLSTFSICVSAYGNDRSEGATQFPREQTLYVSGYQKGNPHSFNPLHWLPAWPVCSESRVMYESLLTFNSMTGEHNPLLATLHERTAEYVSVIMNPAARWSDGEALTGADVAFTFGLGLSYWESPISYIRNYLKEVIVDTLEGGEERVTLLVNKQQRNNPLYIVDFLSIIPILPQHIFDSLIEYHGCFSAVQQKLMNHSQVISGPYNLYTVTNEYIALQRRDDYWGNDALFGGRKAAPRYIVHPIYKTDKDGVAALKNGELDVSIKYLPRIWLKRDHGVQTWYDDFPYYVPGSISMFIINATHSALGDRELRRAMAHSIDYDKVKQLGISGYTPDITSGLILPFGEEARYFNQEDVDAYGATLFDPQKARTILEAAGYRSYFSEYRGKPVLDSMVDRSGKRVPTMFIKSNSGWPEFDDIVRIAVTSMREVGIDVREDFVEGHLYWPAMFEGDFDLFAYTPYLFLSATMPWLRFETIFCTYNWNPVGEDMAANFGRFNNPALDSYIPEIDSLLKVIPFIADDDELTEAYRQLNRIFMQEQPTLPLIYRPEDYYQFSTRVWTNFPTESNPYAPPRIPTSGPGRDMLWEIHLAEDAN
ncbi:Oligopeptide ABC transporter, periplasmic oligopeptide-binding protein OppA [Chitinispirillum alkaliphilum]|nr:Oligopeptide ABC transporter, periplasmic oligopeptide-binding protein OppA [Chitinispirillum alkaliphilum]